MRTAPGGRCPRAHLEHPARAAAINNEATWNGTVEETGRTGAMRSMWRSSRSPTNWVWILPASAKMRLLLPGSLESERRYAAVWYGGRRDPGGGQRPPRRSFRSAAPWPADRAAIPLDPDRVQKEHDNLTSRGFRVLAVAHGRVEAHSLQESRNCRRSNSLASSDSSTRSGPTFPMPYGDAAAPESTW